MTNTNLTITCMHYSIENRWTVGWLIRRPWTQLQAVTRTCTAPSRHQLKEQQNTLVANSRSILFNHDNDTSRQAFPPEKQQWRTRHS